ncbi:MAG: GFA family protein [Rhodobacteraceae bacterium]|nr:GFA family protein [Paracoccaceae bacterium]
MEGRCTCGGVRYRLGAKPLFTHCCHCTWCQRETGSAFALNALIETSKVTLLSGATETVTTPSASGKGQEIHRCPDCRVALWSHYAGMGKGIAFIRVGSLEEPAGCPPDIHIFAESKLPWVQLPPDLPAVPEFYRLRDHWPEAAYVRFKAARAATG